MEMLARFSFGQLVTYSDYAIERNICNYVQRNRIGVVVWSKDEIIRVHWKGRKTFDDYHVSFIEAAT